MARENTTVNNVKDDEECHRKMDILKCKVSSIISVVRNNNFINAAPGSSAIVMTTQITFSSIIAISLMSFLIPSEATLASSNIKGSTNEGFNQNTNGGEMVVDGVANLDDLARV